MRISQICKKNFNVLKYLNEQKQVSLDPPKLKSCYDDRLVQKCLKMLKHDQYVEINEDLKKFSNKLEEQYKDLHVECEKQPPYIQSYDGWGRQVDEIITCSAWKKMKDISSKEGLVAIPYENYHGINSRVHQGLKLFMFHPFSGLYTCPLAMTDGAAFVMKSLTTHCSVHELTDAYHHLISRDPDYFWTSGQWMTEKLGGSDVAAATRTAALYSRSDGCYRLYGYKWFSSATDSDIALTLARPLSRDDEQTFTEGGRGLSLFFLKTRADVNDPDRPTSGYNYLEVANLKNKLGTRQLPTAELILNGTKAIKISEAGRGISSISGMLTITRIHNSISAASLMRHMFLLAKEYSQTRKAFGEAIGRKPLHARTLAMMDVESRAAFYMVIDVLRLLGRVENEKASAEEHTILRLLCPLVKLYTAKQAISVVSEGLECFGGQGYIEDTGLPLFLRDAQVLSIWEGTTNILSLDLLRAINQRDFCTEEDLPRSLVVLRAACRAKLQAAADVSGKTNCCTTFSEEIQQINKALDDVMQFVSDNIAHVEVMQVNSRQLAFALTDIYMATLLLEAAANYKLADQTDTWALYYWLSSRDLSRGLNKRSNKKYTDIDWVRFTDN